MTNQVVWCDIPVRDLDRAIKFYSAVLGRDVKRHDFSGVTVGILPHNDGEVGGCLLTGQEEKPGKDGVMARLPRLISRCRWAARWGWWGESVPARARWRSSCPG